MKKVFYIFLLLPLFLFSCEKVPDANFYVDNVEVEVGAKVFFTNNSHNAHRFEWDFGDGTYTNEPNPVHVYTGTGTCQVVLTAYSKVGLSDKAYQTIDVMIPTLLEVEVLEYFNEYPVKNASVILYPTLADWDAETNMVAEAYTDVNGKAVFSNLGSFVYFVDVWEANHNNYTLRNEDAAFITSSKIIPHEINRFIAYVDYVGGGKGDGKRDRTVIIKSLEKRVSDKK